MARYRDGFHVIPLAALILLLTLLATPTTARAGGTVSPDPQHPPIQEPCANGGICIAAHEMPLAPVDTITVTGYTSRGTAERMMLTIVEPRTGRVVYRAFTTSVPMVGDYEGYSAFRFTVPMTRYPDGIFGFREYLSMTASAIVGKDSAPTITATSNEAHVWSPGFGL